MSKFCVVCGKKIHRKYRRVFCSDLCSYKVEYTPIEKSKRKRKETLCWNCDNACGGCSWSKALVPVAGWEATPIKIKANMESRAFTQSYIVNSCPLFTKTRRMIQIEK